MKNISILGSTGSIGKQTIEVIRDNPSLFRVNAITANSSIDELVSQILEFSPKLACIYDCSKMDILYNKLKERSPDSKTELVCGMDGLIKAAVSENTDILVTSVVGMIGLIPTLKAIEKGTTIALANKETLVTAGHLVMKSAVQYGAAIIPVDSEHSAIYQCLQGENAAEVSKLILTASGGPFRGMTTQQVSAMKKENALKHPNWSMGQKITIDSATLMNKGLEVIEAKWLFDKEPENIEVVVHPQSIIHSMVEFKDRSVKAQLGSPDMKLPIQYALTYPNRIDIKQKGLDFFNMSSLTFEKPDTEVFPCLRLAFEALKNKGTFLTVMNGANEALVYEYLKGNIGFYDISDIIEDAMLRHDYILNPDLQEILDADKWAREFVDKRIKNFN